MGRRISFAVLLTAIFLSGVGVLFPPHAYPEGNLSRLEVNTVLKCQETIKKEGAKFIAVKLELLEECLDKVLIIQVQFENGKLSEAEFLRQLGNVRTECGKKFANIGLASTTLVTAIKTACEVADASSVFNYHDSLGFQALASNLCLSIETATELAGAICKAKEAIVDFTVFTEVPRMGELLTILGSQFYFDVGGVLIPSIPLDSNCRVTPGQPT